MFPATLSIVLCQPAKNCAADPGEGGGGGGEQEVQIVANVAVRSTFASKLFSCLDFIKHRPWLKSLH